MFKKFKDKLAEEVKSSPQRLQQFAQAAQAAVTSASSSISDITNNDLFSIGDSDSAASKSQTSTASQQNTFRDMSPIYQGPNQPGSDLTEIVQMQEDSQRQRRLSNSSMASDISFRLPSYESPSMYHLQSDMEVSASEAEDRGFSSGTANLDRVTKEQLYSAYRRTHDRCKKYKTQYADLARHYKLLERENAKAKNVLVETQDKALRRISELREQCSLEQSAKAHLEKALRIEIDERNMKIHSLNTKLDLLQNNAVILTDNKENENKTSQIEKESDMQLINLNDNERKESNEETLTSEILLLNNKLEKMEQLLNKYKESLKVVKEKNAQMTTEIQILSSDLQNKVKENEELKEDSASLSDSKKKIQELNDIIEELQNKCNTYEFNRNKETSILEINLQSAQENITQLQSKIEELKKKEEEYAISLAENKLSIHKELESKESEIKSLKDSLTEAQNEIQSMHIVINDHKNNVATLEAERISLKSDINEFHATTTKISDMEIQLEELRHKCHSLESSKAKLDEQYQCLKLQMKQETAEKLAMVDRNTYLETRNAQLTEENMKKNSQIHDLETHISHKHDETKTIDSAILNELSMWKTKYQNLEMEIQDEREELIKLQSEIEKLLRNYELVQTKNLDLTHMNSELKNENNILQERVQNNENFKVKYIEVNVQIKDLRKDLSFIFDHIRSQIKFVNNEIFSIVRDQILVFEDLFNTEMNKNKEKYNELKINYDLLEKEFENISNKYKVTTEDLPILKAENGQYKLKIEKYQTDIQRMEEKNKKFSAQHELSLKEIDSLKLEIDNLNRKIDSDNKEYNNVSDFNKNLEAENHSLREKLILTESRMQLCNSNLNKEKEQSEQIIKKAKMEHQVSLDEITSLKTEIGILRGKIESDETQYSKIEEKLKKIVRENCNLRENLTENEKIIESLNVNLNQEKCLCQEKMDEIVVLSNNYTSSLKENEEKSKIINNLQENIESLSQENLTLKKLSETISVNVNKLESEMEEVRKSHAEIEKEKNHLNSIIEQLEKNHLKENSYGESNEDLQDELIKSDKMQVVQPPIDVGDIGLEFTKKDINDLQSSNKMSIDSDLEKKYYILQNENEVLKEENRRLHSDIEGLQIYLAKISKENSALNDKLREYFSSCENIPEKNETLQNDIEELRSEIQVGKERIDNLIRENNILVEENLELKDQIQSHCYNDYSNNQTVSSNITTDQELKNYKDKYNSLLDEKNKLEKKLNDVEQVNQSVDDNMHQMQINNEKLRLSNEKLERRLDEALVSLRHLHSLQENTELEYLRNILYEYLTGSGTHSLTLAKVLAAVVKFTDSQTDLVLQKERERQGFLRQMGLL